MSDATACRNCGESVMVYDPTCCHILACQQCKRTKPRPCFRNIPPATEGDDRETLTRDELDAMRAAAEVDQCDPHGNDGVAMVKAVEAILRRRAAADQAALARVREVAHDHPECWVTRGREVFCTDLVGGTFPNGATWTEAACCLPCRLRAALGTDQ